jgi:hypothetical protein
MIGALKPFLRRMRTASRPSLRDARQPVLRVKQDTPRDLGCR